MAEAGLGLAYSAPALQVFTDAPEPLALAGAAGVVLGPLFERQGAMKRVTALDEDVSRRVTETRGQMLIEEYWGDYVALLAVTDVATIVRAPFSDLPGLHASRHGLVLVASDLELLARCGVRTDRPHWDEVAAHLRTGGLRGARTCVEGIEELRWGNRLTVTAAGIRTELCWDPWQFALAPRPETSGDLADRLRELTLACVKAQVAHLDRVDVMLSGGLDSSILTACLAAVGMRPTCLNLPFGDAIGDERIYARTVARHFGLPIFEIAPELDEVDVALCGSPGLARPIGRSFRQASRLAKQRLAAATGSQDVVDGGGGDSLFCFTQSVAPVADRLRCHGPGRAMLETAGDVARLTGASLSEVLVRALRRAYLRPPGYRWQLAHEFLSVEAIGRAVAPAHAWLQAPRGGLAGSANHIANLVVAENLLDIGFGNPAEWSPLIAQPLVEFCLSVPSWHWVENGHNRAVARRAFEKLLPPEIAWRRGKGTPDGFVAAIFEANREKLSELLIGGMLDQASLLDGPAIAAALLPGQAVIGYDYNRILRIADVEAWVRALPSPPPTPLQAPSPTATDGAQPISDCPVTTPPISGDRPEP
ncbi:asparagine synthase C-terminal domain-containing protein [Novosphingobium sp. PS1R-30]|uniref:asparagine synthase (glutamine-hydrolyzing) n=1 Tax=Novosphingobium anseongense TaxID=3133436 RepID=A0ABU8S1B4_9SPHN